MKRSRINDIIREADAFIRSFGYIMPPFAYWSPDELKARTTSDSQMIDKNAITANHSNRSNDRNKTNQKAQ